MHLWISLVDHCMIYVTCRNESASIIACDEESNGVVAYHTCHASVSDSNSKKKRRRNTSL